MQEGVDVCSKSSSAAFTLGVVNKMRDRAVAWIPDKVEDFGVGVPGVHCKVLGLRWSGGIPFSLFRPVEHSTVMCSV